jgi:hypothetical protein
VTPPVTRVRWPQTHRLVLSHFPPIDLYNDVGDPHDREALAAAQARTNPRLYEEIGDLALVPPHRRLAGPGASWVMAAFTHVSPDRTSRFSDGSYGVYCAGRELEAALREHTFDMGRFYADAGIGAAWISEARQLIGTVDAGLVDLRGSGFEELLDPGSYARSQEFARARRAADADGIVYPSVRHPGGECIAAFFPDVVTPPDQGDHFRYHWDGESVGYVRKVGGDRAIYKLRPASPANDAGPAPLP